jgi:hypothetical protein
MWTRWSFALVVSLAGAQASDIIHLKADAALAGKILAEKPEQVVLDVGYTVLSVPRDQIRTITHSEQGSGSAST